MGQYASRLGYAIALMGQYASRLGYAIAPPQGGNTLRGLATLLPPTGGAIRFAARLCARLRCAHTPCICAGAMAAPATPWPTFAIPKTNPAVAVLLSAHIAIIHWTHGAHSARYAMQNATFTSAQSCVKLESGLRCAKTSFDASGANREIWNIMESENAVKK